MVSPGKVLTDVNPEEPEADDSLHCSPSPLRVPQSSPLFC